MFDGSGFMALPWANSGATVYCFNADDADHGDYAAVKVNHPNIHYVNAWIGGAFIIDAICGMYGKPDIIFAFPPCTDMAVSGAPAFPRKKLKDPLFQEKAVETAKIAAFIADHFRIPYMIENPVSVLATMWRPCDYMFHPWEYGAYLPEDDIHPFFPEFIKARDAYQKRTCLWTGNGFRMPEKKPVAVNDGYSDQYKRLGGKSKRTKLIRSLTPRGFARAVFMANQKRQDL